MIAIFVMVMRQETVKYSSCECRAYWRYNLRKDIDCPDSQNADQHKGNGDV
jgi:hypothetical protein